jgi:membrane protease YdiL (CAAX protease family)
VTYHGRLFGWIGVVGSISLLSYAARAAGGRPDMDALYQWGGAIEGAILYTIILGVVLFLAHGPERNTLLALRQPGSWKQAAVIAVIVLVAIYALSAALDPVLHADREQGLTPPGWDGSRAAQYAANFVVIAGLAPIVEELTFRGLGYSLLERYGQVAAVVLVGIAFGLWHGLVYAFPLLAAFGAGLAYLRARTESVYPGIILHSLFNAIALVVAVTT